MQFDASTTKLVETVRKDKESANLDLQDDVVLVKTILKWLYKGIEQSKRCLGPVLKPYLNTLFHASHSASWHLEVIKKMSQSDEMEALGAFAGLINDGCITPAQGLLDAINKNWNWAKDMLKLIEHGTLRVTFIPKRGYVLRHILSLPNYKQPDTIDGSKTLQQVPKMKCEDYRRLTLPSRNYFNTIVKKCNGAMVSRKLIGLFEIYCF